MHDGIYRRKDSPYWWASWTESGKTIRKSTGVRIAADPRGTEAKRIRAGFLAGSHQQPIIGYRWLDLVGQYISDKRASWRPCTLKAYRQSLAHLVAYFGEDGGLQSRADVKAYIRHHADKRKPSTINLDVSLMSGAYRHAMTELEMDIANPWESRALRADNARNRYLTREEADRLIAAAESSHAWYLADFIRLALNTGMRHGELLCLTWDRVDMDAGTITFDCADQKNGKRAVLPINAGARLALGRLLARRKGPHVFHADGQPISKVDKAFDGARTRAGLPDVKIHDLRRTFGSWLVQSGVSIHAVSGLLRHSDIRITARVYAHLGVEEFREAASVLDSRPRLKVV